MQKRSRISWSSARKIGFLSMMGIEEIPEFLFFPERSLPCNSFLASAGKTLFHNFLYYNHRRKMNFLNSHGPTRNLRQKTWGKREVEDLMKDQVMSV